MGKSIPIWIFRSHGLALLLALGLTLPAGADLPPHEENHPNLLFDMNEAIGIRLAIEADSLRHEVWEETLSACEQWETLTPDSLLSDYCGFKEISELCLVSRLGSYPDCEDASAVLVEALLFQVDAFDADPHEPFYGVMGTALRLGNLALGYDCALLGDQEEVREILVDEMRLYLDEICNDEAYLQFLHNPLVSNKSISIGAAMLLAVMSIEEDQPVDSLLAAARETGQALVDKGLGDLLGDDGSYSEGIAYFSWAMRTLLPAWEAQYRRAGQKPWSDEQMVNAVEWLLYQALPEGNGLFLNRNDSNSHDFLLSRHHSFLEWATLRLPAADRTRWLLRRVSGDLGHSFGHDSDPFATLLWHSSGGEQAPASLTGPRLFPDGGLFAWREGWPGQPLGDSFLLTLEARKFMGGHAQEDVGQITCRSMGLGIAVDNGAGWRGARTLAHSIPLIDGEGQHYAGRSIGTDGSLSMILDSPFCTVLVADMAAAYNGHSPLNNPDQPWEGWDWSWGYGGGLPMRRATRHLMILPGEEDEIPEVWLLDDLQAEADGPHVVEWRLQMEQDLNLAYLGGGLLLAGNADGDQVRMYLHSPHYNEFSVTFDSYNNGNVDPNTKTLRVQSEAARSRLLWQWTSLRAGEDWPVTFTSFHGDGGLCVTSEQGARERVLLLSSDGDSLISAGDFIHGEWGLVERENGVISKTALVAGHGLSVDGVQLFNLETASSAAYDGEAVYLAEATSPFRVWAPDAQAVLSQGQAVPYRRDGDWVLGPLIDEKENTQISRNRISLDGPWPQPGKPPLVFKAGGRANPRVLEIFDVTGRLCARLQPRCVSGQTTYAWDGRDRAGHRAAQGIYLARLADSPGSESKFLLLR